LYYNGPKQEDAFITIVFQLYLGICQEGGTDNKEELELNGTHQLLFYADDINLVGGGQNLNLY
jgi:hypothetical protein